MLPLTELRASIPFGLVTHDYHPLVILLVAWLGNLVPVVVILWWLDPLTHWLMRRSVVCHRFFSWLFRYTFHKHSNRFDRWGSLALLIFTAIPLPVTGGWTAALLAYLFGVKFRYAFINIALGLGLAGGLVTILTLGGIRLFAG